MSIRLRAALSAFAILFSVHSAGLPAAVTVYSGRSKNLVEPVLKMFTEKTGIEVNVRYGDTAELAAMILEEGENSPADLYFAQDAGALGAVAAAGLFRPIAKDVLDRVDSRFHSEGGLWTGTSGRARVVAYNTNLLKEKDLPETIDAFTSPEWRGKLGWAPSNASFQAFVTALRLKRGDEAAKAWLKGILANEPKVYPNNSAIVEALGRGEIAAGFVNHYYLLIFLKERGDSFPVRNHYLRKGDPGAMINVAGAGLLKKGPHAAEADKLLDYLLSAEAQNFFVNGGKESEYPMVKGVPANPALKPLAEIESPDIDLTKLSDLKGTLALLRDAGALD